MRSESFTEVDQGELQLSRAPKQADLPLSTILKRATLMDAINLCIAESGLEDKEIYIPLGIDPGHWTCIRKGSKHFPASRLEKLMDICGNDIPLVWLANKRGFELRPLLSDLEAKLEAEKARNADLVKENSILRDIAQGRR